MNYVLLYFLVWTINYYSFEIQMYNLVAGLEQLTK
jgi:hypothetical protein